MTSLYIKWFAVRCNPIRSLMVKIFHKLSRIEGNNSAKFVTTVTHKHCTTKSYLFLRKCSSWLLLSIHLLGRATAQLH